MLNPGETIERYKVVELIGVGGHAAVYRVRHTTLESDHAIKVLNIPRADIRARLIQEGRIQARLRHPNIVPVTDVLDVRGQPALLMPYVAGPDLGIWLERHHPASLDTIVRVFRTLVEAIQVAHEAGLVHRDLKPGNILMAGGGAEVQPRVTDFGIAKIVNGPESAVRTRTGIGMGTPSYMAPEQVRNASTVDHRADIFALGCILYELLTGQRLYAASHPLQVAADISSDTPVDLSGLTRPLSPALRSVLAGCLEKSRAARFADCSTLLTRLAGHESWTPPPSSAGAPPSRSPRGEHPITPAISLTPFVPLAESPTTPDRLEPTKEDPPPRFPPTPSAASDDSMPRPPPQKWVRLLAGVTILVGAIAATAWTVTPPTATSNEDNRLQPVPPTPTSSPPLEASLEATRSPSAPETAPDSPVPEPTPPAATPPIATPSRPASPANRPEAQAATAPAEVEQGWLKVHAKPWGNIWVDGEARGRTWQTIELPSGSHEVLIRSPEDREYRRTVSVPPAGGTIELCWDFDLEEVCSG